MKSPTFIVTLLVALTLLVSACAPAATPTAAPASASSATQAPAPTTSGGGAVGKYGSSKSNSSPTAAMPATMVPPNTPTGPATVNVTANSKYGSILTDAKGMTLYLFTKDTSTTSTCTDGCATIWPALLTSGSPAAGTGVDGTKLGTTTRPDGTVQVTYNGHPLYYFAQDKASGDANGQGIKSVWYVVSPTGDPIKQ